MTIEIAGRKIGDGQPCFIVAEAGVNHNGSMTIAKHLISVAANAGCDAVKFQKRNELWIYTDEQLAGPPDWHGDFGETMGEYWEILDLQPDKHRELQAYARELGLIYLCSAFDEDSLGFVVSGLDVPAIKVPSCMIHDRGYLEAVAACDKPVILSTGMSDMEIISKAMVILQAVDTNVIPSASHQLQVALLHCVSSYPCDYDECHLAAMQTMRNYFRKPVGWSGHEKGLHISLAARVMGACIIERHITIDRTLPGCDHAASLEPSGLFELVRNIRDYEIALGQPYKKIQPSEMEAMDRLKVKHRPEEEDA